MINTLTGTISYIESAILTVEVAGCGFAVSVPHHEKYTIGQTVSLFTYLHWNPESGPALFGFSTSTDRQFFLMTTSCSGLGPKLALSLLNQASIATYVAAITCGDTSMLHNIKGLGPKKAETLVRELRPKIEQLSDISTGPEETFIRHFKDLNETLTALKYSSSEINHTLDQLRQQQNLKTATFDQLLRSALAYLQKAHV